MLDKIVRQLKTASWKRLLSRWAPALFLPAFAPILTSCAVIGPTSLAPSLTSSSMSSSLSSSYSFSDLYSSSLSTARQPADEVRIESVPLPSSPNHERYSGVAAIESLTHYWGDPTDWRDIAAQVMPPEGGRTTPSAVLVYLRRGHYEARLRQSSFDAVRDEIQRGRPVLLFLRQEPRVVRHVFAGLPGYVRPLFGWFPKVGHVLLVVGYDRSDRYFLCHSGNDAQSLWRHDELDLCWSRTARAAIFVVPKSEGQTSDSAR